MKDILTKEHIIKYGVKYDLLYIEHSSNRVLSKPPDEGGVAFTGLVYDLNDSDDISFYSYFENGLQHGLHVKFYDNGSLALIETRKFGLLTGVKQVRYKNGKVKSIGEYKYSICLHEMLWDQRGILLKQKLEPTEPELLVIKKAYLYFKKIGRE
ncbi:hypothetical protein IMX26_03335 [Clostridium sp. 'deep sea']|uniref:hypothetical protein n=1 Tax=Clostridium sp. 'deep sea' TaxID=2779445 RepID=UPI00189658C8|nr:hypothetical protein [Clostridium sp. 'deep sea']QOR35867.1 hypothetical protein IMX26_03335 [Clostridium sp. 'deep sea']